MERCSIKSEVLVEDYEVLGYIGNYCYYSKPDTLNKITDNIMSINKNCKIT